jgi:hypothetical protein
LTIEDAEGFDFAIKITKDKADPTLVYATKANVWLCFGDLFWKELKAWRSSLREQIAPLVNGEISSTMCKTKNVPDIAPLKQVTGLIEEAVRAHTCSRNQGKNGSVRLKEKPVSSRVIMYSKSSQRNRTT